MSHWLRAVNEPVRGGAGDHPSFNTDLSPNDSGQRPVYGGTKKFQTDPHWKDHLLFYEYFHGDNGAGLGANHQTGWTGLVATMIELFGRLDGPHFLEMGRAAAFARRKVEGS